MILKDTPSDPSLGAKMASQLAFLFLFLELYRYRISSQGYGEKRQRQITRFSYCVGRPPYNIHDPELVFLDPGVHRESQSLEKTSSQCFFSVVKV